MSLRLSIYAVLACALLSSCREAKVKHYRVPKEKEAPPMMAAGGAAPMPGAAGADNGMANIPVETAAGAGLTWTAPADWQEKAASAMRKGSYTVPGPAGDADLSITAFPGDVGGDLANVNRWRGQLLLPPLAEADLAAALTRFSDHGLEFKVVELANDRSGSAQRVLGAIVPVDGATWFFKLTGPDATVAAQKDAFLAFLHSVQTR